MHTLSALKRRLQKQLNELPGIMELHLNHSDTNLWRRHTKRYLRELDAAVPGDDWEEQYDIMPWHPPNEPAKDTEKQRRIYIDACNSAGALLGDALSKLLEVPSVSFVQRTAKSSENSSF